MANTQDHHVFKSMKRQRIRTANKKNKKKSPHTQANWKYQNNFISRLFVVYFPMNTSEEEDTLIVTPGTPLIPASGFMQGHGTFISSTELPQPFLVANSLGQVERVNRLVSVKPIRSKYIADVGDLVVGSIIEVRHRSSFSDRKQHIYSWFPPFSFSLSSVITSLSRDTLS